MSGTFWTLVKIDGAAATVHLQPSANAVLECYQTPFASDGPRILLGTFDLSLPEPILQEGTEGVPAGLRCVESAADLFATITLESSKPVVVVGSFQRALSADHTLRKRGGKAVQDSKAPAKESKAGYSFAKASLSDQDLKKGTEGGVFKGLQDTCFLRFRFGSKGRSFIAPLLFPSDPISYFLYDEQTVRLSFRLVEKGGDGTWELNGPRVRLAAHEFREDSSSPNARASSLRVEYGNPKLLSKCLHPRNYLGYLSSPSYGQKLIDRADEAAAYLDKKIPRELNFSVSALEILTTFICEGANLVLDTTTDIDATMFSGYASLGIDSLRTRWKLGHGHLRDYVNKDLEAILAKESNSKTMPNESGKVWETPKMLDYKNGIWAIAALFALAKEWLSNDLMSARIVGPWGSKVSDLPEHVQFFWGTLYFNAGDDAAPKRLRTAGIEFHDEPWLLEDDPVRYGQNAKYNATWRTATFRLLQTAGI